MWLSVIVFASLLLASTLAYVLFGWRRSPLAQKAMYVVGASALASGILAGLWVFHLIVSIQSNSSNEPSSAPSARVAIPGGTETHGGGEETEVGSDDATKIRRIGVFALTDKGLVELSCYGSQARTNNFNVETYGFKFADRSCVPTAHTVNAFFLNLPGANISEAKIFGLPDLDATWLIPGGMSLSGPAPTDPTALTAEVENVRGTIFKIYPKHLAEIRSHFIALVVPMPLGTPDRMYAVALSD
jgi:hypothetical protein